MKGKWFWVVIALSSIAAAIFGYQRFKKIRPDLYDQPSTTAPSESERAARIAGYQQKGDALTRAAVPRRTPASGQSCVDGFLVEVPPSATTAGAKRVIEGGKPVACETASSAPPDR